MSLDAWIEKCNRLIWDVKFQSGMLEQGYVPIVDRSNRSVLSLLNEIDEIADTNLGTQVNEEMITISQLVSLIRMKLGFPATCFDTKRGSLK